MTTLLMARINRAFLYGVATLLIASLLAPIAAVAANDLAAGDSAVVSGSDGANLRSDMTTDESTIIAELPKGTTVWVQDGPYQGDTGMWVYVATDGYGPGFVSTTLLSRIGDDELADTNDVEAEEVVEEEPVVTSEYAWLEPIDSLVVVDNNFELTEEGLPVLNDAYSEAPVLGHIHVGGGLDVTSERIWNGDQNFVRVNYNGVGGFVDGRFVVLTSETVAPEPTEEVIWVDEPEEAPVEEVVTEEAPVEEVVTEEVATEEVATEEVVTEEVATEEVATEEVATEEVATEEVATEEVATEEVVTEEVATEEVATEEVATEEAATEEVATEEAVESSPEAEVTEEASGPTEEATEAPEGTQAPVETEEATEEAVEEAPVEEVKPIASTADAFDADSMIGSATVTGTNGSLVCRSAPSPSAPVLMTLAEGTTVLVSTEAENGYLGIDCGGLQGFADVNYLWSGGAGDSEINAAKMNVVVTGTGNGLNCRTGASTSHSVITVLYDGTTMVTRGKASNGWTPVTCAGQNGFVSTTWIEAGASNGGGSNDSGSGATAGSAVVNTGGDGLYCRSGAGTTYGIITVLSHGATVSVRGANQGQWTPIVCGGVNGFAHASYLNVGSGSGTTPTNPGGDSGSSTPTGTVRVANTGGMGLNCRTGAGTGHGIITTLSLGQSVQTRSGSTNGWTAVICGGSNGFVSSEFVTGGGGSSTPTPEEPSTPSQPSGMVNGDHAKVTENLNMRYSASMSASISMTVPAGKVVLITGNISNGFYPVDYDGLTGFMHSDYMNKTSEALSKRGGSGTPTNPGGTTPPPTTTPGGSAMVNYAMRYVGYPYVWATHGPASFDCSGFTYWVTLNVKGKNIGTGTWTQVSAGTPVSKANLQPGDLVFFQNTYTAGLSHVGLYIGNGQFVHAQNEETGVVVSDLNSSYYGPRWYGAVRI